MPEPADETPASEREGNENSTPTREENAERLQREAETTAEPDDEEAEAEAEAARFIADVFPAPPMPEETRAEDPEPEEPESRVILVDAARLAFGKWDAETEKDIGEGDIHKSYSGDTIPNGKIRGVITMDGKPYVTTGFSRSPDHSEQATLSRLYTLADWGEKPITTYGAVTTTCRHGHEFSYEGIKVKHGRSEYVLGASADEITAQAAPSEEVHQHTTRAEERICEAEQEAIANGDEPDEPKADDLCDLCMASGVHVDRTTYCGKSIGIECGCDEDNEEGRCGNPDCKDCTGAPDDDDGNEPDANDEAYYDGEAEYSEAPEADEPAPPAFTLAPTPAAPAKQLDLFGSGEDFPCI